MFPSNFPVTFIVLFSTSDGIFDFIQAADQNT